MSKRKWSARASTSREVFAQVETLEPRRLLAAVLVKDINTASGDSTPSSFVELNGKTYFLARGLDMRLYETDGTPSGTRQVKPFLTLATPGMIAHNGALYFAGAEVEGSLDLWKSDGTPEGTVRLKEGGSTVTLFKGELYFPGLSDETGTEIWKTDGTPEGTVLVADVIPGPVGSQPAGFTAAGDYLYFYPRSLSPDLPGGPELWVTDGTAGGTRRVEDIRPGPEGAFQSSPPIVRVGDIVYFSVDDGSHGIELWKSDGTEAGTVLVKDIRLGTASGITASALSACLTNFNGTLYFCANDGTNGTELWKTDGTENGTVMAAFRSGSTAHIPRLLTVVGSSLYFRGSGSSNEVWKSDGTQNGTTLLKTFSNSQPTNMWNANGTLFLAASDGVSGEELWTSNGTPAGTRLVKDINPGPNPSAPQNLAYSAGKVFFTATDGTHGSELMITDGSAQGTFLLGDLNVGTLNSTPDSLVNVDGRLYFRATTPATGQELWTSDGTAAGTHLVEDIFSGPTGSSISNMVSFNGLVYFIASDGVNGTEIWRSDGTEAGTFIIDVAPGALFSKAGNLTVFDGNLYFTADHTGGNNIELYRTDGTSAGVTRVKDINPGTAASSPGLLKVSGDYLYFRADTPRSDSVALQNELWRTDGTETGTEMVIDLGGDTVSAGISAIVDFDGHVLFTTVTVPFQGLWRTDGTSGGTEMIFSTTNNTITRLKAIGDKAYFTGGAVANDIWITNGTSAGTIHIPGIGFFNDGSLGFTEYKGMSFFTAGDGSFNSFQLWRSDGTIEGTTPITDFLISPPSRHTVVEELLFFSSNAQLWRTDGTTEGTFFARDLARGIGRITPDVLTNVNGTLFFRANTPDAGIELGRISPPSAHTSGPYSALATRSVQLNSALSSDPDPNESLSFSWDLDNDGLFGEIGPAALNGDEIGPTPLFHAPSVGGLYPVKLRVTNSVGMNDEAQSVVEVDGPPVVSISPPANPTAGIGGDAFFTSGSFTDLGPGPYSATVDFGDGAGESPLPLNPDGTFTLSRTYNTAGSFTVRVAVTDGQGQVGFAETTATVRGGNLVGSVGDDTYLIEYNHDFIIVTEHLSTGASHQFVIADDLLSSFRFDGLGGNDQLLIDLTLAEGEQELLTIVGGNVELEVILGDQLQLALSNDAKVKLTHQKTRLRKLTLANTSRLTLTPGGSKLLKLTDLLVGPSATLDLNDNDLILQPASAASRDALLSHIRARVKSAYNNGSWTGPGITSSAARDGVSSLTGLAIIRNSDDGVRTIHNQLHGETLNTDSLIVRHTWNGDADASGTVNRDDYARIDRGYFARASTYQFGDFDHDQAVDVLDYLLIDRSFLQNLSPTILA